MESKYKLIIITFLLSICSSYQQYSKKVLLKKVDIHTSMFIELIMISFILIIFILNNKSINDISKSTRNIDNKSFLIYLFGIILLSMNVIGNTYLLNDYNLIDVTLYGIIFNILITMIISYFILKENINNNQLIGIFIIMIGIYIYNKNGH
jgi:drug/metabolite transporter (DMT)-like permease